MKIEHKGITVNVDASGKIEFRVPVGYEWVEMQYTDFRIFADAIEAYKENEQIKIGPRY